MSAKFNLKEWERKRKTTFRVFVFQTLLLGMDYSVTFLTLWIYIKTLVKTDQPKLFYSLISASYLLSAVIFSIFIGRWVDRTRSVRTIFFVCNSLVVVGNLVYLFHHSPWLLVVGRFLGGLGDPLRSVVSGEIVRSYSRHEISKNLSSMAMAFSIGLMCGPAVNIAFKNVDFTIGILHVTYANVLGIYMAGFFIVMLILVFFFAHDLSKEYDLKAAEVSNGIQLPTRKEEVGAALFDHDKSPLINEQENTSLYNSFGGEIENETDAQVLSNTTAQNLLVTNMMLTQSGALIRDGDDPTTSISTVLLQIIKNFDLIFVFALSFLMFFWIVVFDMWLPLMVIDTLGMGVTELSAIVFGTGFIAGVVMFVTSRRSFSDKELFKLSMFCMVCLVVMQVIFGLMKIIPMKNYMYGIMWSVWATSFAIVVLIEEVFLVTVLAKMTSSKVQTFAESLRTTMTRIGALVAFLSSAVLFDYVEYACLVGVGLAICINIILLARRKTFQNPQLILG